MPTNKTYAYAPDYAVAPGESLREAIEYLGMTQVEFAQRMGMTPQSLSRILSGKQPITHETAQKLEFITGISREFWNNLEARYREQLQIIELKKQENSFKNFIKLIPVKELAKRGYIQKFKEYVKQGVELLKFYKIGEIAAFDGYAESMVAAARSSPAFSTSVYNAVTYITMGMHEAEKIDVADYDEKKFKEVLGQARSMIKEPPKDFGADLQELFASAGVALVYVPAFTGVSFSGASKWISSSKAMIIMNIRGKREDRFWFSLFHEAAHILKHSKTKIYIAEAASTNPEEEEAERFAAHILIPAKYDERIKKATTEAEIIKIAEELDVSPGIVAGRYQHLNKNWKLFNNLFRSIEWADEASGLKVVSRQ